MRRSFGGVQPMEILTAASILSFTSASSAMFGRTSSRSLRMAVGAMLLNGSVNGMIPLLIKRIINTIAAIPNARFRLHAFTRCTCWRLRY